MNKCKCISNKRLVIEVVGAIIGIIIMSILAYIFYSIIKPEIAQSTVQITGSIPSCIPEQKPITKEDVKLEIVKQALEADVNIYEALKVSKCESNYDHLAKNKTSSAKGVYQFLDGTWRRNCTGNVLNHKDNIACFMKLYKKHKSWWVCKG